MMADEIEHERPILRLRVNELKKEDDYEFEEREEPLVRQTSPHSVSPSDKEFVEDDKKPLPVEDFVEKEQEMLPAEDFVVKEQEELPAEDFVGKEQVELPPEDFVGKEEKRPV